MPTRFENESVRMEECISIVRLNGRHYRSGLGRRSVIISSEPPKDEPRSIEGSR